MKKAENKNQTATKQKRRKRSIDPKTGLTVFYPNTVYCSNYLEIYIGSKWIDIRESLYAAGYRTIEISRYRDDLINDFAKLCRENRLHGIMM